MDGVPQTRSALSKYCGQSEKMSNELFHTRLKIQTLTIDTSGMLKINWKRFDPYFSYRLRMGLRSTQLKKIGKGDGPLMPQELFRQFDRLLIITHFAKRCKPRSERSKKGGDPLFTQIKLTLCEEDSSKRSSAKQLSEHMYVLQQPHFNKT